MDVSIIVVTHNSSVPVSALLESLERHEPACSHETIVIDNASADGTPGMIRTRFPGVRLEANDENVGYARGVNQGIRIAAGRAILVLNPDIEIRDAAVDRLLAALDARPRAGIVASRLVYPDGRLQYSCRSFYTASAILLRRTFLGKLFPRAKALRTHLLSDWDHETPRRVDWVIGACMMVRREALDEVGPMDERFFLYFEDIDWCYRMKHHDWEVWYEPGSTMVHRYERSSSSMLRKPFLLHVLSLLRYVEKWNRLSWFFRRHREALKTAVFLLVDIAAVNAAFFAAYYLRHLLQRFFVYGLYPLDWYTVFILFANLIFVGVFAFTGLYRVRRGTHWTDESIRVARAVFLVFAILLAATYLGRIRIYSRAVLLSQAVFSVLLVTCFRRIVRFLHRQLVRARFDLKRVLLVGSPGETAAVRRAFTTDQDIGIDVVGAVTGENETLCDIDELSAAIERHKIQEIVVLPSFQERRFLLSVLLHRGKRIPVRLVSSLASFLGRTVRVGEIGGVHFFSAEGGGGGSVERLLGRCLDIAAGSCLLAVSAIAWLAVAAAGRAPRRRIETRHVPGGQHAPWPRALRADGGDVSDLLNPSLFVYLLGGRLTLIGPPSLPDAGDLPDGAPPYRPGIAGRWRYDAAGGAREAVEEELLDMRNRRFTGDLVTVARSFRGMAAGRYPEWFTRKDER